MQSWGDQLEGHYIKVVAQKFCQIFGSCHQILTTITIRLPIVIPTGETLFFKGTYETTGQF